MKNVLHCTNVGCKCCKKAIRIGKTLSGKKLYVCKHSTQRHQSIDGWDCKHFSCSNHGEYLICNSCRG